MPIENEIVLEHLEKILASAPFRASKRCQEFLRFVVDKNLAGQTEFLKERVIGAEVFGRDSSYEPSEDAIVRVKANEVRKRLAQYYVEAGAADAIRIDLPPGTYIPEFKQVAAVETVRPVAFEPPPPRRFPKWGWAVAVALPLVVAAGMFAIQPSSTALDQFWEPITSNPASALVCTGSSTSYILSNRLNLEYLRKHPEKLEAGGFHVPMSAETQVRGDDILPVVGEEVSVGTFYSVLDIATLLERKGKQSQVRTGGDLATDELSEHSIVLVGGFTNPWTMELGKDLRFSFKKEMTAGGMLCEVVDRQSKEPSKWALTNIFHLNPTDHDFAIVTRILHQEGKQVVVSAAGLTRYGTQIAGEFITNAVYFNEAMKAAPRGWERKNLQIVLETDVVGRTPNAPRVLAMHFW